MSAHLLDLYRKLYEQDTGLPAYGKPWEKYVTAASETYKSYVGTMVASSPDLLDEKQISKLDAIDAGGLTDTMWPHGLIEEHMPYAQSLDQPVYAFAPCFQRGIMVLPDVPGTIRNFVQFDVLSLNGETGTLSFRIRDYCQAPDRFEPGIGCDAEAQVTQTDGDLSISLDVTNRLGFPDLYTRIPPRQLGWDRATARQWRKTVLQNAVDQAERFRRADVDPCLQLVQRFLSACLAANAGLSASKPVILKEPRQGKAETAKKAAKKAPEGKPSDKAPPERRVRVSGLVKFSSAMPPKPASKTSREYRTASWTARGHVRRYKSGKQVYIKPMVKHRKALAGKEGHVPSTVKIIDNRPKEPEQEA